MDNTVQILLMVAIVNMFSWGSHALSPQGNLGGVLFCEDPGTPENGRRRDQATSFHPGMTVNYYCDPTYRLVGPQNRTCLANGSWTFVQPFCEKYMCNEREATPPKSGKRIGKRFTIGSKLKFKCSTLYTLVGQEVVTCLPDGQWSAKPPICEHRCNRVQCSVGMVCKMRKRSPICVCRSNMECSSKWDPVCGSDGVSYNNECILKASACRLRREIRSVSRNKCLPGDRCSIVPLSMCRASFNVYFYNVTAGKCQPVIAGGCHPSGWNGFFLESECASFCERDTCSLKPLSGPCHEKKIRWYYDTHTKFCQTFTYGGCFGNANNFRTIGDCKKRCI